MKNYLRVLTILFAFILLTNCEKENVIDLSSQETKESAFKVRTIKLSEIPTVRDFLVTKTNLKFSKSTEIDGAIFDEDNVMEVLDTLNRTNYTLRFSYADTPIGTFYNLVVGKTPQGENITPYVLKYICDDEQLDTYITNDFRFNSFKGNVEIHKYTDYFQQSSFTKSDDIFCPPTTDSNGDPIPCDTIGVDGGTSGGGPSDSSVNNPGGDGTSYNSTGNPNPGGDGVTGQNNDSGSTGDGSSSSGGGTPCIRGECYPSWDDCKEYIVYVDPDCLNMDSNAAPPEDNSGGSLKSGDDDCPDCGGPSGPVGVLPEEEVCPPGFVKDEDGICVVDGEIIVDPITFKDYPCQEDIVEKSYQNNSDLAMSITNTFSPFNPNNINLLFKAEDIGYPGQVGATSKEVEEVYTPPFAEPEYNITIIIDTDYLQTATDLAIATTAIHEQVHSFLVYLHETGSLLVGILAPTFEQLIEAYAQYQLDQNITPLQNTHHEYMTLYVDEMTDDLFAFAQESNIDVDKDYCNKLIWGRLSGTNSFSTEFPVLLENGAINPDRVIAINGTLSESENRTISPGSGYPSTSPQGSPCNN